MSRKNDMLSKAFAGVMTLSIVTASLPVTGYAVTGSDVAADGTYTSSKVYNVINAEPEDYEWTDYDITVGLTVVDGLIDDITVTPGNTYSEEDNASYLKMALSNKKGILTKLKGQPATADTINGWDTVSGATIVSSAIKEAAIDAISQAEEKQNDEEGYVYGTVNLSYADFYYGELNEVEENSEIHLDAADKVTEAGYREKGIYDAVSSATTSKSKRFGATYFTETGTGVDIEGIRDVYVAIPKKLYKEASAAIEADKECNNSLLSLIKNVTLLDEGAEAPSEYKILNGDGTLTKMVTEVKKDTGITAEIATGSVWGDYLISLYKDGATFNPVEVNDMLGCVIETSDGAKYGLTHLENLWLQTYEFSFAVTEGFVEPHGNTVDFERFADIQGKTITKITYLVKNGADIEIDTGLKVKRLLDNSQGIEVTPQSDKAEYKDGAKLDVKITAPAQSAYSVDTVTFAGKELSEGSDYTYTDGVITVNKTDNTGIGKYTVLFTDTEYENVTASFILNSAYANEEAQIEGNALVLPEGVDTSAYVKNISSVSVNGKVVNNAAAVICDENGAINLAAATTGRGATTLFPKYGDYEVVILSDGYPAAKGTVTKNVEKYLYGTVDIPYADFYYGELNTVEEKPNIDLEAEDKVTSAGYREKGMYDAVSSATTNKSKKFETTYFTETENGVEIEGIKAVNIAIPSDLYEKAMAAAENNQNCNNKLLDFVKNVTLADESTEAPSEYKILNGDGTFTKMVTEVTEDNEVTAQISTDTKWGNYLISLSKAGEAFSPVDKENMLGCVIETKDGAKYGLVHLENLYTKTYEFAFAATEGFIEPHGNTMDYERFADIQGKTITKITYLVKDGADVVINTELKVKRLLGAEDKISATPQGNGQYKDKAKVDIEIKAPSDSNYNVAAVAFGGKELVEGEDYTVDNNVVLTINETDNTAVGQYQITFEDKEYEDITVTFILNSEYADGKAVIENNALVLPEGIELDKYIKNIFSVSVNEVIISNAGYVLFNEDGSVNIDAATTGKKGVTLFPDYASYHVVVESYGYPKAEGTVVKEAGDKDKLKEALESANAIETDKYTDETVAVLKSAVEEADKVISNASAGQEEIDAVTEKLNEAVKALKEKEENKDNENNDNPSEEIGSKTEYRIINEASDSQNGASDAMNTWKQGSSEGLVIVSEAPFDKFEGVIIDGQTVNPSYYTAEEGSTRITLKKEFLDTLSVGSHEIIIRSTDGDAKTAFTVAESTPAQASQNTDNHSDNNSADSNAGQKDAGKSSDKNTASEPVKTGDNTNIWGLLSAILAALGVLGLTIKLKKKEIEE